MPVPKYYIYKCIHVYIMLCFVKLTVRGNYTICTPTAINDR